MLEEVKHSLHQPKTALIIWNRHQTEFEITEENVSKILNAMKLVHSEVEVSFLVKFFPDCLSLVKNRRELSQILETICHWIVMSTKSLEAECKRSWPQCGIEFGQTMLDALFKKDDPINNKGHAGITDARIPLLLQEHKNTKVRIIYLSPSFSFFMACFKVIYYIFVFKAKQNQFKLYWL